MNATKLKKSGYSFLVVIIFLVILILLNVFTGMLTERFFLKADITETGIYTLSDRAAEFLGSVNETVDIIVLAEESSWRANPSLEIVSNILRNYSASSGGYIRIQYVNPNLNSFNGPEYNNSLSELKEAYTDLEDMTNNDIILLSSRRATLVSAFDLFAQSRDQLGRPIVTGVQSDQELISALIYVLNEKISRIVFTNNHRENPAEMFSSIFERSGYVSAAINLALEDIPEDTIVLVSVAPKFDFLADEIIKLEQFIVSGGSVIILYDAQLPTLPVFDAFLAGWGVEVENKLIFDEEFTFIPQFGIIGAHVVAGELPTTANAERTTSNRVPLGVFNARPLSNLGIGGGFSMFPLIQTFSDSSYAKDLSSGELMTGQREAGDSSGPFTLAYNVRYFTEDAHSNLVWANLIVAGASMFDDTFLEMYGDSFYNNFFIADLAIDLNPYGERVFIPAREFADSTMLVSATGARTILILMVILLPLMIIAAGVIVWRKRRHK